MHTHGHGDNHVAGQTKAVCVRQQAQIVLAGVEGESRTDSLYVGCIVAVGEHYTLGVAC